MWRKGGREERRGGGREGRRERRGGREKVREVTGEREGCKRDVIGKNLLKVTYEW